jgi:hypothetical protein
MQKEVKPSRLSRLMSGDFEFRVTDYISQSFQLIQQNIGGFIGFTVLLFVVQAIVGQIEESVLGGNVSVLSYIISALWLPGYYIVARKIHHKKDFSFNDFFDGHKQGGRLLGVFFLVMIIAVLPLIPGIVSLFVSDGIIQEFALMIEATTEGELYWPQIGMLSILLLVAGFVVTIYLQVSYLFAIPLVTFTSLGVWEAMEMSRKVVAKKFFAALGLVLLAGLINVGGVLLLFVGLLFTYPAMMCATYLAFDDLFQLESGEEDVMDYTEHIVE